MKSVQQLIGFLKPASGIQSASQVKPALDKQLKQAAEALKGIILTFIQAQHRHPITNPSSDIAQATQVSFDTGGLTIDLPDYAAELDAGRKPGSYPPFKAILQWVLKYRLQAAPGGRQVSANQFAFAIRRSIYQRGIKPRPFLDNVEAYASELVATVLDEVIFPTLLQPLEAAFSD